MRCRRCQHRMMRQSLMVMDELAVVAWCCRGCDETVEEIHQPSLRGQRARAPIRYVVASAGMTWRPESAETNR